MRSSVACGLIAAIVSVSAAIAAPADPVFLWGGLYIGAHGGYGWGQNDFHYDGGSSTGFAPLQPSGAFGGLQVGYNQRIGASNWVLGTEFDVSWGPLKGDGTFTRSTALTPASATLDTFGSSRIRVGYAIERVLAYATGGLAWSRDVVGDTFRKFDGYHVGWAAGAGLEYAFDPRWSAKIEYLYADLGRSYGNLAPTGPIVTNSSNALTLNLVRAGVNYRFGDTGAVAYASAAPAPRAVMWTGSYIGAHVGYGRTRLDYDDQYAGVATDNIDPKGGFAGVQAGYNWRFSPSLVFGLESDTSWASLKGEVPTTDAPPHFATTSTRIDAIGTVRARLGFLTAESFMLYGTGGLAYAHQNLKEVPTISGGIVSSVNGYQLGWTAGGGVEVAFHPDWSGKLEYLHAEFAEDRFHIVSPNINRLDMRMSMVRVGLNYHGSLFGRR
jgi:outer membrane immunogenic protein